MRENNKKMVMYVYCK